MIKIENIQVFNLEGAIRGMRFPMQSNHLSDSFGADPEDWREGIGERYSNDNNEKVERFPFEFKLTWPNSIGPKDMELAKKLIRAGSDHSKFTRQILVSMDITGPLYWWKEADTYKVGTTTNSESTMHTLSKNPITKSCFSFDPEFVEARCQVMVAQTPDYEWAAVQAPVSRLIDIVVEGCENLRLAYLETKDVRYWRALIQLLPSSWNQKRHWTGSYANLLNMGVSRQNHRLSEWREFIDKLKQELPYYEQLLEVLNER